jgi:hypothetical protein
MQSMLFNPAAKAVRRTYYLIGRPLPSVSYVLPRDSQGPACMIWPMVGHDPVLNYASSSSRSARRHNDVARVAQLLAGFGWGGVIGLVAAHLLVGYTGAIAFCCVPAPLFYGASAGVAYKIFRVQVGQRVRWRVLAGTGMLALVVFQWWTIALSDTRLRAEMEHGMRLPPSAHHFQCRGDALTAPLDRAAITWFEISAADLGPFLAGLKPGNVVPPFGAGLANAQYSGHVQTWSGTATFNQIVRCASPVGDFLIVEVWDLPAGGHLIKMYTDWN